MTEWNTEWPTEPGDYWFYGWTSIFASRLFEAGRGGDMRLVLAHAFRCGDGHMAYSAGSEFLYPTCAGGQPDAQGLWLKCDTPELPTAQFVAQFCHGQLCARTGNLCASCANRQHSAADPGGPPLGGPREPEETTCLVGMDMALAAETGACDEWGLRKDEIPF
jgi:hypothetical protein